MFSRSLTAAVPTPTRAPTEIFSRKTVLFSSDSNDGCLYKKKGGKKESELLQKKEILFAPRESPETSTSSPWPGNLLASPGTVWPGSCFTQSEGRCDDVWFLRLQVKLPGCFESSPSLGLELLHCLVMLWLISKVSSLLQVSGSGPTRTEPNSRKVLSPVDTGEPQLAPGQRPSSYPLPFAWSPASLPPSHPFPYPTAKAILTICKSDPATVNSLQPQWRHTLLTPLCGARPIHPPFTPSSSSESQLHVAIGPLKCGYWNWGIQLLILLVLMNLK